MSNRLLDILLDIPLMKRRNPIELDLIRDTDEEYWDAHRGTPKAYVSLATGERLFGNRFGNVTAIRGPVGLGARLAERLPRALKPASHRGQAGVHRMYGRVDRPRRVRLVIGPRSPASR